MKTLPPALRALIVCLSLSFAAAIARASTFNVGPGQIYTNIQSAIDAATTGDTVLIAPGIYYENIDFKGKAIIVTSSAGPATTIIDGSAAPGLPTVTFKSSESSTAVLSSLTIQHGGGLPPGTFTDHGGVYIYNGAPTILNNIITSNYCYGISSEEAAPRIEGNVISATQGATQRSGGCFPGDGAAIFVQGHLNGSSSPDRKGASATIIGNTIENNVSSALSQGNGGEGGAAVYILEQGSTIIQNNVIRNNISKYGFGGAISTLGNGSAYIVQNTIYGNQAGCGGGAFAFGAGGLGAGFYALVASNTIVNNTGHVLSGSTDCGNISQIFASPDIAGLSGPTVAFVNNIISGSTNDPAIECTSYYTPLTEAAQPLFDHNLLYNAGRPFFGPHCIDVSARYGNVSADPQFVNLPAGDFHLKPASPAIDHGVNSGLQLVTQVIGSRLVKDIDGQARVQDATGIGYPIIDMGAFEYSGPVEEDPTTIVLTPSSYYGSAGSSFVLTATLASSLGTPTGTASFFLDGKPIGTSSIGGNSIATLANFLMPPGVHSLYATYPGQGQFTPATSVIIIIKVDLYTTSLSLMSSFNPSQIGQSVTFTVHASSADPNYIPSPVTLTDAYTSTTLATLLTDALAVATFSTTTLAVGSHPLTARYAGDSAHMPAQAFLTQIVANGNPTATTLTCTPNPIPIFSTALLTATVTSSSGTPTGTLTFAENGTSLAPAIPLTGATTLTYTGLTAGTHTLTATYSPTSGFAPSTESCA